MFKKKDGFGTVELVILTSVLIGLALFFREGIGSYAQTMMDKIKSVEINIMEFGE